MKITNIIILFFAIFNLTGCSQAKLAKPVVMIIDRTDTNNTKQIVQEEIQKELFKAYKKYNITSTNTNLPQYKYTIPKNCKNIYDLNKNYAPGKTINDLTNNVDRIMFFSELRAGNRVRYQIGRPLYSEEEYFKNKQNGIRNRYNECVQEKNDHFVTALYMHDNLIGLYDVHIDYKKNIVRSDFDFFYYTILDNKIYIIRTSSSKFATYYPRAASDSYSTFNYDNPRRRYLPSILAKQDIMIDREIEETLARQLEKTNYEQKDDLLYSIYKKSLQDKNAKIDILGPFKKQVFR